jgi:hypothetical protein
MPLSINKLEEFITEKGFVINKFFTMDGSCFYIEVICVKTADIFLLYIPSKYEISPSSNANVYKIKTIDMTNAENFVDEYTGQQGEFDIENRYGNMQINLNSKNRMDENLENNYKHAITLEDISKEDLIVIKSIYRQLKRLKYCVQNIKYKIAIIYKNYICAIRRDDSIDCFSVKDYPYTHYKGLMIIVDLETFYDKHEQLSEDINVVYNSIFHVLERNQHTHVNMVEKIIETKKDIVSIPFLAEQKKIKYDQMLSQLYDMLKKIIEVENKFIEKLSNIENGNFDNLQKDIDKIYEKTNVLKELDKINTIKVGLSKTIFILKEKRENMILSIDKIMFDNTVMYDCMVKNFSKLKDLC